MSVLEAVRVKQPPGLAFRVGPPSDEDRLLARLVDGRAIHFHLHFIEPLIHSRSNQRPAEWDADVDRVVLAPGLAVSVGALGPAGLRRPEERLTAATAEALRAMAELGLRFFVDLAVDLVAFCLSAAPLTVRPAGTVVLDETDATGAALAAAMARGAAEEWIRQWMQVEEGRDLSAPLAPGLDELMSEFGSAVVHELARRWNGERSATSAARRRTPLIEPPRMSRQPSEVLHWLDGLPGALLAKELFCCWYPHWHRTAFIVDSPLDHLVDLPRPGDGPRRFTEALELHRRGLVDGPRA